MSSNIFSKKKPPNVLGGFFIFPHDPMAYSAHYFLCKLMIAEKSNWP